MKSKLVRKNPIQAPKPVGKYSHVTIIPKDATMYVFSGQIGLDQDDQLPQTLEEQITNTFYQKTLIPLTALAIQASITHLAKTKMTLLVLYSV